MANHLDFDLLSRLAEKRASALDEAGAERHLYSCGRCRSELEWLERIHTAPGAGAEPSGWGPATRDSLIPSV
ncbi:MAG: hypothetical protein LC797_22370 [Chloroflexi bacterium]|nr:hypothetical protein [Chloroflexota bacterium]